MGGLGLRLDERKNQEAISRDGVISAADSRVAVLVVPTNEELKIAMDTYQIYLGKCRPGHQEAP